MCEAAEALRLTAQDLQKLGVADVVIPEPVGGAQRDREATMESVRVEIAKLLVELSGKKPAQLRKQRRKRYLDLGSKSL